jgi:hypothetical protein
LGNLGIALEEAGMSTAGGTAVSRPPSCDGANPMV